MNVVPMVEPVRCAKPVARMVRLMRSKGWPEWQVALCFVLAMLGGEG